VLAQHVFVVETNNNFTFPLMHTLAAAPMPYSIASAAFSSADRIT
jgi:hypothetical protein